ncbi:hypothetical protein Patl1_11501 [Pistacia atlantica]|uniref:Uncharacterized protein n=1 Tax=Pistacia atlantica TaxID=434234 RepID=A0ACC1A7F6_9ROSI|nr:hypothetical protein Patl1_11501 [Pistacia atlantica]
MGDIAKNWKELSGENDWEGLLDPLNINLRQYIIHYGERVQAVYDSFNYDKTSGSYGFPLYAPKDIFSNVGLEKGNSYHYTVTNYIYAMIDIDSNFDGIVKGQSTWIGYVAVGHRRRKGYVRKKRHFDFLERNSVGKGMPQVHKGFHSLYTSCDTKSEYNKFSASQQVLSSVKKLVDKYKDEEISITITGHSLGSALATLNAAEIVSKGYNKPTGSDKACIVTAFVFASPKVGDKAFKTAFNGLENLHLLRIRNIDDIVPTLPTKFPFFLLL